MSFLKKNYINILIILILFAGVGFRVFAYGDFRLSVGYTDTFSYVESAENPLFSWELFAGTRLFTTNLIYKFANDPVNCPPFLHSNPALGVELDREILPCYENIVLLQNILSIIAWSLLAWSIARSLKNPTLKVTGAFLILAFAFTPQIAEWDYILSPESLTFSLFAITISLLLEIILRINQHEDFFTSNYVRTLIVICMVVFIFWVFVRDVHLYTVLIAIPLLASTLFFRKVRQSKIPIVLITILVGIFLLGYQSAKDSLRATHYPLEHAFEAYIFPYSTRVDYMKTFDMPERASEQFESWFDAQGTKAFGAFLITHPGFVITTLWENTFYFASDFEQPYFKTQDIRWRDITLKIGQFLHPETLAVYLIDLLILLAFFVKAIKTPETHQFSWIWVATFFFFCSAITLVPSFFGDTVGIRRHIFPSVEMFRLFLWIFLLPHLDVDSGSTSIVN